MERETKWFRHILPPKVERVNVDWENVKTVEDIKDIMVLMAKPNTQVIICNVTKT